MLVLASLGAAGFRSWNQERKAYHWNLMESFRVKRKKTQTLKVQEMDFGLNDSFLECTICKRMQLQKEFGRYCRRLILLQEKKAANKYTSRC